MSLITNGFGSPKILFGEQAVADIHYIHGQWEDQHSDPIRFQSSVPGIHLLFSKEGSLDFILENGYPYTLHDGHQNILVDKGKLIHVHQPKDSILELVEIRISKAWFESTLHHQPSLDVIPMQSIQARTSSFVFDPSFPLTQDIKRLLQEISNCPLTGYYKDLYLKAKVTELLAFLYDRYARSSYSDIASAHTSLTQEIRDRMHMAKEIILARLHDPLSLPDLAQHIGTNERYLKDHFKTMFGTTVFGFIHDVRMEKARNLLGQGEKSVAQVARMLGFKHASHFTSVFKKQFGITPKEVIR